MKLVFCGTPQFAVPTLEAVLDAGHEVALVITQPDRAAGRKMELQVPAVKRFALERCLPVVQPEKIRNNPEFRAQLEAIAPEAILVVAYGRIIPDWMLALPRFGNINLHGSLLPKYRGAAPIQWAVAHGDAVTGVTTMVLEAGLDTGPMLLAHAVPIGEEETAVDVFETLAAAGAPLMVETLRGLENKTVRPIVQDHPRATLAPILTREDGLVDFAGQTAHAIYNRWRGFQPWPGAYSSFRGRRFLLQKVSRVGESHGAPFSEEHVSTATPGELMLRAGTDGVAELRVVCAHETALVLHEVQLEGKPRMAGAEFWKGFQCRTGERLG
jgi:methionyl-tRNA formyltransferase